MVKPMTKGEHCNYDSKLQILTHVPNIVQGAEKLPPHAKAKQSRTTVKLHQTPLQTGGTNEYIKHSSALLGPAHDVEPAPARQFKIMRYLLSSTASPFASLHFVSKLPKTVKTVKTVRNDSSQP